MTALGRLDLCAPQSRDWTAQAISPVDDPGQGRAAMKVACAFTLTGLTGDEVLYATTYGVYAVFVNLVRLGPDLLAPGWTIYDARITYLTYPLAGYLREGENWVEMWLGDGVVPWPVDVAPEPSLSTGARVFLTPRPERMHKFRAGQRTD